MALHPLQGIELFSGVGMLGEGLRAGFAHLGIPYRAICHVEREAYAASVMVARMEEGSMDAAPVWSDVTTFDATAWRGKVDCIVAGFPCQDLSVAGKRAGLDGKRSGLFFEVTRIADDSGARLILLENVAGIASATATVMDEAEGELEERAAARVLGELADLGWDAEWVTLSASDVGASHGRARWFCLAWKMGHTGRDAGSAEHGKQPEKSGCGAGKPGQILDVADAEGRRGQRQRSELAGRAEVEGAGEYLGDTGLQHQHLQQRTDGAEHQATGSELAHPDKQRTHRSGSLGQQAGRGELENDGCSMAYTELSGWGTSGFSECKSSDTQSVSNNMADTGSPRFQERISGGGAL